MSESIFLITISLPLLTILLVFAMRYFSAVQQAKARLANDHAYQQIATTAVTAQATTAAALTDMAASLTDIRTRLATVEQILKQVG